MYAIRSYYDDFYNQAVENFKDYISSQTLSAELILVDSFDDGQGQMVEIDQDVDARIFVEKKR